MMDYMHQNIEKKTPGTVFDEMLRLASYLYPRENSTVIAAENIYALAGLHFNRKEYAVAAKLFRSAAEYGNHGDSQNYLAVLYNAGAGVKKTTWFLYTGLIVPLITMSKRQSRTGMESLMPIKAIFHLRSFTIR